MSQIVIYKGVVVTPKERDSGKILIQTTNPADARKADIPFKDMEGGQAMFEAWVPEGDLVAVD